MNNDNLNRNKKMLAIVIPFYRIDFFIETISSLVNQTNRNFNLYIGDDCSDYRIDDYLDLNSLPFEVHYTRFSANMGLKNLGRHFSRCVGLAKEEEWVMILGDDDYLDENCVQDFYFNFSEIEILEIDVLQYATVTMNQDGNKVSEKFTNDKLLNASNDFIEKLRGKRGSLSEIIFKKSKLEELDFNLLPMAWMLDWYAVLKCSNYQTIYNINSSIVYVRYGRHSISGSKSPELEMIKNYATYLCLKTVLLEGVEEFKANQLDFLRWKFEKTYLNHRKNKKIFFGVVKYYMRRFEFSYLMLFLFRVIQSIILYDNTRSFSKPL